MYRVCQLYDKNLNVQLGMKLNSLKLVSQLFFEKKKNVILPLISII